MVIFLLFLCKIVQNTTGFAYITWSIRMDPAYSVLNGLYCTCIRKFTSLLEPCARFQIGPNKKISVFRVMGLKILGRVGTHIFSRKKYMFMHFERHFAFQNA